jgi:hypothetical protein
MSGSGKGEQQNNREDRRKTGKILFIYLSIR